MQFDDLDTALRQLADEVGVVALGILHPHDVVEEQVVGVGRGEPAMCQTRRADQYLAQPADFGMDAECRRGRGCFGHGVCLSAWGEGDGAAGAGQSSIQPTASAITPTTAPAIETAQMTASAGENRRRFCSRLALTNKNVAGA